MSPLPAMITCMWQTSERLLHLLSLLQQRREWNADELGEALSVTTRTVRRDIARLRDLGYPVASTYGSGGGYQLEAGVTLPPLMFDAGEAVSTVLALRSHAGNRADGPTSNVLSALDKLTRVMPPRLQATIAAVSDHSSEVDLGFLIGPSNPPAELDTLIAISRACREERQLRCVYSTHSGDPEARILEPLHLVKTLGHWYLVAYCLDRKAWRTFRVDRMSTPELTKRPTSRRAPPSENLDSYVEDSIGRGYRQVTATVRIGAAKEDVEHWIMPAWGTVTAESATTSIAKIGAENHDVIARWLLLTNAPLTVIEPPELRAAFARLASRCSHVAGPPLASITTCDD